MTASMPAPKGGVPGAGTSGGNFMIVPASAREKQGAWDFVKFWSGLSKPEIAAEFYTWGGWAPLSERVANAPAYLKFRRENPQFETFVKAIRSPNLQVAPPVAYQVFIQDTIGRVEDLAIRGTLTPEEALKELEEKVAQEQRRRKELGYDE
jgi:multiple sugar transport system substrate-binding protein